MNSLFRGEASWGFVIRKNWIAVLSLAIVGTGFVANITSRENAMIDWDEILPFDSPRVRVRVLADQKSVALEGTNLKISGRWFDPVQTISFHRIGRIAVWVSGGAVVTEKREISKPLLVSGKNLTVKGVVVPNSLRLLARDDGRIDVLADLTLDKYVEGVLAGEMPSHWPLESLKAQAVAARSFLLAVRRSQKHRDFDIDSSQFDQVYRAVEALPKIAQDQIHRAVVESQGLVLKDGTNYPMPAYFHSDCGGVTEKASSVWGRSKSKRLAGPKCPFNPGHQWILNVSKAKVAKTFGLKSIKQIVPIELSESGRVVKLKGISKSGVVRILSAAKLRKQLGFNNLKSTLFEIEIQNTEVQFRGRGFGHGVGLCQWGSKYMADKGSNFIEILSLYYPKARVVPLARGFQVGQQSNEKIRSRF